MPACVKASSTPCENGKRSGPAVMTVLHNGVKIHDKVALIWEGEPGDVRKLTYGELDGEVCRLASALRELFDAGWAAAAGRETAGHPNTAREAAG